MEARAKAVIDARSGAGSSIRDAKDEDGQINAWAQCAHCKAPIEVSSLPATVT